MITHDGTSAAPATSVLIATHKRASFLERVLRDLAAAPLPEEVREIRVLENGGRDDTEALCDRFASRLPVRYQFVEEPGKSNALNVGLDATEADFIVLFDDDIRVEPDCLSAFVQAAGRHGPGHYFGGPVAPEYEAEPPAEWLRPWLTTCVVGWDLGEEEQPHDEFLGANWAAFREDLLEAGGFTKGLGPDARYRTMGQEVDMQQRLLEHGCTGIYVPGAKVQHWVPARQCTLGWVRDRWRKQSLSKVLLEPAYSDAPRLGGVPRFVWRTYLAALARVTVARLTAPRSERRMRLELRLAVVEGQILGYRRVQRLGGLSKGAGDPTGSRRASAAGSVASRR